MFKIFIWAFPFPEKEKGRAFTEKFVKDSKPQAIPGGGWYLETKAGSGPVPAKTDTIKAHYRGTTIDGAEFDSSYTRGEPTQFALNAVIACWTSWSLSSSNHGSFSMT